MIEIANLQKMTGQQLVLDIPALRIEPGQVAAIAGPAGSGVEVLFDVLIGRARPSAGGVRLARERSDRQG
jgi:ABC-type transporter Mla maintaining outer membrane lipid asymmetry ATPase subunit MlaF